MGSPFSPCGLAMRRAKEPLRAGRIKIIKHRAVMQNRVLRSPLRVAGYLPRFERQIAIALHPKIGDCQRAAHPIHHPVQAVANIAPCGVPDQGEHNRIVQASWPEQHGSAAGTSPEHLHRLPAACIEIYIALEAAGLAQNDAFFCGFPESDDTASFGQQRFIEAQMVGWMLELHVDKR